MTININKYHGAGNDFILLDRAEMSRDLTINEMQSLCHRQFGIGADGIIIIGPHADVDFLMEFYNSDGSSGAMCSNGSRCAIAFARVRGYMDHSCHFICCDRHYTGRWLAEGVASTSFPDLTIGELFDDGYLLDTGAPHFVSFCERLDDIDAREEGRTLRYSAKLQPHGANINYVQVERDDFARIVTYERGVEDLTLACGTGALAAVMAHAQAHNRFGSIKMAMQSDGGTLIVSFHRKGDYFFEIEVEGPVTFVFKTSIML